MMIRSLLTVAVVAVVSSTAAGTLDIGTSDISDGIFAPTENIVVDLSLATTGLWSDDNSANPGNGIYDADQWAIVFKYDSVNVPSGVEVTFSNHPSGAPVIWLVQGAVLIDGTVALNGESYNGGSEMLSVPGAGGFRGGRGNQASGADRGAGLGPGAGGVDGNSGYGGSYGSVGNGGTNTYGNDGVFPLIGGSGGGGTQQATGRGGAGGGGIMIASAAGTITVNGMLQANGGNGKDLSGYPAYHRCGGGGGGGIRLVCETIAGGGFVQVLGGTGSTYWGGRGRVRVEADETSAFFATISPKDAYSYGVAAAVPQLMRSLTTPWIRIVSIDGVDLPTEPTALVGSIGSVDHLIQLDGIYEVVIETTNVPLDWLLTVRLARRNAGHTDTAAIWDSESGGIDRWLANVEFVDGIGVIRVRAESPPAP